MIAGLHCAHILFYNRVIDDLGELDLRVFPSARGAMHANGYLAPLFHQILIQ